LGVFRGLISWVSEHDGGFYIFDGGFQDNFSELTEPGSGLNCVVEPAAERGKD
jgi:hypothetical protein